MNQYNGRNKYLHIYGAISELYSWKNERKKTNPTLKELVFADHETYLC